MIIEFLQVEGFIEVKNIEELKISKGKVEFVEKGISAKITHPDLRYYLKDGKLVGLHISGQEFNEENWQFIEKEISKSTDLQVLYLRGTSIKSIGFSKVSKLSFLLIHNNQRINNIHFSSENSYLEEVRISGCKSLTDVKLGGKFPKLKILELTNCAVTFLQLKAKTPLLRYLNFSNNEIADLALPVAPSLAYLYGQTNVIEEISLEEFQNIELVDLSNNALREIIFPERLENLATLELNHNQLESLGLRCDCPQLQLLNVSHNKIQDVAFVGEYPKLKVLDLSNNFLSKIDGLTTGQVEKLQKLDLRKNSITELPEEALANVQAILGHLISREKSDELVLNKYLKVNIIGEGRIGKTQLLNFLNKKNYVPKDNESHGTSTIDYTVLKDNCYAQIWDFGGQSYHHGFHQVFIRPYDFNIILWSNKNSSNPNFNYWLGAARNYSSKSPLILVQNVWTETDYDDTNFIQHAVSYPDSEKLKTYNIGLDSIFSINVKALHKKDPNWKNKHDYFLNTLNQAMIEYIKEVKTFKSVPRSWVEIKKTLDQVSDNDFVVEYKSDFKKKYAEGLDKASFETLLYYLEFTGNVLYFSDNYSLYEYVFVNPPKLSDWIYQEILNKDFKESADGILDFKQLVERIGEDKAWVFREIIESFNLVFEEKGNEDHLVIPQFLPEQNNSFKAYLLDLLPASFSLRFADFISEGRIFQFISEYGEYAIDKSSYWRYGIIFTQYEVKAMVHYDATSRTVFVHIEEKKGRLELAQEIFDFFVVKQEKENYTGTRISKLARDLDLSTLSFSDFLEKAVYTKSLNPNTRFPVELEDKLHQAVKDGTIERKKGNKSMFSRAGNITASFAAISTVLSNHGLNRNLEPDKIIDGVQLSTNRETNYVDVKTTIKQNSEGLNIGICVNSKQTIKLDYLTNNLLGMENHKLPKVFISYSRKDLEFKDELKSHLSILERYDLIKSWSCDEMRAGKWDKQIQTELEEANIIVYMVSHNFMSSDYIMENEVKRGIKLAEEDPSKKIMCVLVRECMWTAWDTLEKKYKEIAGDKDVFSESMNLSEFQFLPYHQYKNNEGKTIREEIVALEQWGRNHYEVQNVAFKQIASKILQEVK